MQHAKIKSDIIITIIIIITIVVMLFDVCDNAILFGYFINKNFFLLMKRK